MMNELSRPGTPHQRLLGLSQPAASAPHPHEPASIYTYWYCAIYIYIYIFYIHIYRERSVLYCTRKKGSLVVVQ